MDLRKFYPPLLELVKKASAAILDIYDDPTRFEVDFKSDDSPLTAADRASNDIICKGLQATFPEIPIISEENKQLPFEDRSKYDLCWLVDPLDGTKEFVKRNGEFTINIALVKQGKPILGVMHIPVLSDSFIASENNGSYKVSQGRWTQLSCRSFDASRTGLGIVCSRSHLSPATHDYLSKYPEHTLVPKGSALKFAVIAQGQADLYPRLGPTMEWDTAAAQVILEEAGGQVLDFERQTPLQYNKPDLLNPNFIACGNGTLPN